MWTWISANATTLGIAFGGVPTIWAVVQFILNRRAVFQREQFETYHSLIKQLVQQEGESVPMRIDRQIAVIFELRHFRRYYPVTLRILRGLKVTWANGAHQRLQEELDLSIAHVSKRLHRRIWGHDAV